MSPHRFGTQDSETMATCDHCGTAVDHPFRCTHCDSQFCGDHRLPEKHDCPLYVPEDWQGGESTAGTTEQRGGGVEAPEPIDLSDRATPGSSNVEGPSESPPAVETSETPADTAPSELSPSRSRDWKLSLELVGLGLRGTTKNAVRLLGVGLVLLAAYNALLVPVSGSPSLAFYRVSETAVATGEFTFVFVEDVAAALLGAAIAWVI